MFRLNKFLIIIIIILMLILIYPKSATGQYAHPANAIKTNNSNVQNDIDNLWLFSNSLYINISTLENKVNNNFTTLFDNISTLENKLDDQFNFLYINLETLETKVNNNFDTLFNNISTLENKLDNNFNTLYLNISTLETKLNNDVSMLFNNISTLESKVDNTFNNVFNNLTTLETKIDNNLNIIYTNVSTLEAKVNDNFTILFNNISTLETTCFNKDNQLYTNIGTLEAKLNDNYSLLYTNISTLENKVDNNVININNNSVSYPVNFINSDTAIWSVDSSGIRVNVIGGFSNDINGIYKIYGNDDVIGSSRYEISIVGVNGVLVNRVNESSFEVNIDNANKWDNYYTKTESDNRYSLLNHSHSAADITVNTSNFNKNLNSNHDNVQKALDVLDDLNFVNKITVNGETDIVGIVNIIAGTGMEITTNGNNITFSAIGGGGGSGIFSEVLATMINETTWELDTVYNHNKIIVFRNGVFQRKGSKYTLNDVSGKTRIIFTKTTYVSDEIIALIIN